MTIRLFPELPLLRRELTELAARKRTYVLRVIAAVGLLGLASTFLGGQTHSLRVVPNASGSRTLQMLGIGESVFLVLVQLLYFAVWLFMPSLVCGSIAIEKERNTLGTLFVTRLSPLTIILEKLGSRLVPMLSFIILSFPILAWLYSFGGVEYRLVGLAVWLLIWESILFASFGLMCSAWYSTTVAAFMASYVLTGVLILCTSILRLGLPIPSVIWGHQQVLFAGSKSTLSSFSFVDYLNLYFTVWPTALASAVLLLLAKRFLVTRAEVSRRSLMLRVFRVLDQFFQQLNQVTTGGRMVVLDRESLPKFDPVAWRERAKKSLGKPHYLLRILLVLEFPVLSICILTASTTRAGDLTTLLLLMWTILVIVLSARAATLISSERSRETLEPLLSTPMKGGEILRQKVQGMQRLIFVLCIPILTVHFSSLLLAVNVPQGMTRSGIASLLQVGAVFCGMVIATWVPAQLIAWISLRCGLRGKTQTRSVIVTQLVIGLWFFVTVFAGPFVLDRVFNWELDYYGRDGFRLYLGETESLKALPRQLLRLAFRPDGALVSCQHLLRALFPYTTWQEHGFLGPNTGVYFVAQTPLAAWLQLAGVTLLQWLVCILLRRRICRLGDRLLNRTAESGRE
jgi:hypothetical protein